MSDTANIQEFLAHSDWLKELARGIVRDPDSAEDVVQETWLRTLRKPPRTLTSPRGWLHRVATNSARGLGRSERARRSREDAVRTAASARPADEVVERAQIHALLAKEVLGLDEPYRSTVLLRYYEDEDVETIARLHEVSPSTVRTRIQRALIELRRRCERRLGPDDASHGGLLALAKWCHESPRALAATAPSIGAWALFGTAAVLVGIAILAVAPLFTSSDDSPRTPGDRASTALTSPSAQAVAATPIGASIEQQAEADRVPVAPAGTVKAGHVTELACDGVLEANRAATGVEVTLRARVVPSWLDGETAELSVAERARAGKNQLRIAWSRKGAKEDRGSSRTDTHGVFELPFQLPEVQPSELLLLRAETEDDDTWRSSRLDLALRPEEVADELFTHLHVRRAAHGYLTGRVLTTHRTPLADAQIRFRGQRGLRPSDNVTAVSAADGSYRLGPLRGFGSLELQHPDFVGFDHGFLIRNETGGWATSDLFVVPSGVLRIRVLQGDAPVANAAVRLWTDARSIRSMAQTKIFREAGWNMPNSSTQGSPLETLTDAEGWAELRDVWVGKRMQIEVEVDGVKRIGARVHEGRIVFGDRESHATPLALHDREPRELEAIIFDKAVVTGRVLGSDGTVRSGARIRCEFDDQRARNVKPLHLHTKTDMEGRFELVFPGEHAETRFLATVTAGSAPASAALQGLGYLGEASPPAVQPESATVGFAPATVASEDAPELEVVLGPAAAISGEVLLPDGQAAVGQVYADLHDGHDHVSLGTSFENGRFEITGLCADTLYDLRFEQLAERANRQLPIAVRSLHNVPAGTTDLKVVFDAPGQVGIDVRLDGAAKGALLYRWAPEVDGDTTPRLPARSVVAGTTLATSPDFDYVLDGQLELRGESTALPTLPAGRLQLVLLAHDDEMRPFYWSILGPVAIHPGQHTITFELSHTGSVRGRIAPEEGAATNEAVSLVDEAGRSLLLGAGPHWFQPTHQFESGLLPVGPDGSFEVYAAPVGTWRLRFGTVAQIVRGEFNHEQEVEVSANETLWLELGKH